MVTKLIEILKKNGLVDSTNDKIIATGLSRLFYTLTDILFATLCSFAMGNVVVGVLFEICYSVLRIFSGGYHAPNEKMCKYLTYGSTLSSIFTAFFVPIKVSVMHCFMIIFVSIVVFQAPVENKNKPLAKEEKRVYYRYCLRICLGEAFLYCIFIKLNVMLYAKTICIAMMLDAVGVLLGKMDYELE